MRYPNSENEIIMKCQLYANETIPGSKQGEYSICTDWDCGKSTVVKVGDCHPEYMYCKEKKSCVPILYSSCGYNEWANAFKLGKQMYDCFNESPRRFGLDCLKKILQNL